MNIIKPIFLGILAAISSLVVEGALLFFSSIPSNVPLNIDNYLLIFIFAAVEEFFLGLMVWKIVKEKLGKSILINSISIGIGFSIIEIILNYTTRKTLVFPYLGLILIHSTTALIFGYYFLSSKNKKRLAILGVFLTTAAIHFFFNLSVLRSLNPLFIYPVLLFIIVFLAVLIMKNKQDYPCQQKQIEL